MKDLELLYNEIAELNELILELRRQLQLLRNELEELKK